MSSASFRVKYAIFTFLIRHKCSDEKSEAKSHQAGANNTNTDGLEQVLNDLQILPQNSSELLHDAVMHNSPGLQRRKPRPVSRISQLAACQDQDSERLSWIPTFCWKGWFVQDRQIWVRKSIQIKASQHMSSFSWNPRGGSYRLIHNFKGLWLFRPWQTLSTQLLSWRTTSF